MKRLWPVMIVLGLVGCSSTINMDCAADADFPPR